MPVAGAIKDGIGSIYCKAIEKLVRLEARIAILPIMIARGMLQYSERSC